MRARKWPCKPGAGVRSETTLEINEMNEIDQSSDHERANWVLLQTTNGVQRQDRTALDYREGKRLKPYVAGQSCFQLPTRRRSFHPPRGISVNRMVPPRARCPREHGYSERSRRLQTWSSPHRLRLVLWIHELQVPVSVASGGQHLRERRGPSTCGPRRRLPRPPCEYGLGRTRGTRLGIL